MENQMSLSSPSPSLPRSFGAVASGVFAVVALSLATDQLLHVLDVYPPWGEAMHETSDNLLALGYRTFFNVLAGYLVAQLAPWAPVKHAVILGAVGTVLGLLGAIATIPLGLGPAWYPIALVVEALPTCWFGGWLAVRAARG